MQLNYHIKVTLPITNTEVSDIKPKPVRTTIISTKNT